MQTPPSGWLLVDKPLEWTSFDVVNKVRGLLARQLGVKNRQVKVGHLGTLDPMASGLLVLAIGSATKQIQYHMKLDKTYEATVTLGFTSDTGDQEGKLTPVSSEPPPQVAIEQAIDSLRGEIEQIPPQYSALKIGGVPAYKRARRGEQVEMKPRPATIYEAKLTRYEYPEFDVTCQVSSGTYIRTLAEDYGKKLQTGAYLSALRRIRVGEFDIADAVIVTKDLSADAIIANLR